MNSTENRNFSFLDYPLLVHRESSLCHKWTFNHKKWLKKSNSSKEIPKVVESPYVNLPSPKFRHGHSHDTFCVFPMLLWFHYQVKWNSGPITVADYLLGDENFSEIRSLSIRGWLFSDKCTENFISIHSAIIKQIGSIMNNQGDTFCSSHTEEAYFRNQSRRSRSRWSSKSIHAARVSG